MASLKLMNQVAPSSGAGPKIKSTTRSFLKRAWVGLGPAARAWVRPKGGLGLFGDPCLKVSRSDYSKIHLFFFTSILFISIITENRELCLNAIKAS